MPIFDKDISKIKMVVLTKGKNKNITWYSIISKDKRPSDKICEKMLADFEKHLQKNPQIRDMINLIQFFENQALIATTKA